MMRLVSSLAALVFLLGIELPLASAQPPTLLEYFPTEQSRLLIAADPIAK